MGGGYFPLEKESNSAKILLEAAEAVEKVCDNLRENIYCGEDGQFDNSASDGGSLARLSLAVRLIKEEIG